jgi:hypothetical protein
MRTLILFLVLVTVTKTEPMNFLQQLREECSTTYKGVRYMQQRWPRITNVFAGLSAVNLALISSVSYDKSALGTLVINGVGVAGTTYLLGHLGNDQKKSDQKRANKDLVLNAGLGYIKGINACLEEGADINCEFHEISFAKPLYCPLYATFFSQRLSLDEKLHIADYLKERGANINWKTKDNGTTLLMLLAKAPTKRGLTEEIRWLLHQGADRTATNCDGDTAFDFAWHPGRAQLIKHYQIEARNDN